MEGCIRLLNSYPQMAVMGLLVPVPDLVVPQQVVDPGPAAWTTFAAAAAAAAAAVVVGAAVVAAVVAVVAGVVVDPQPGVV